MWRSPWTAVALAGACLVAAGILLLAPLHDGNALHPYRHGLQIVSQEQYDQTRTAQRHRREGAVALMIVATATSVLAYRRLS